MSEQSLSETSSVNENREGPIVLTLFLNRELLHLIRNDKGSSHYRTATLRFALPPGESAVPLTTAQRNRISVLLAFGAKEEYYFGDVQMESLEEKPVVTVRHSAR